MAKGLYLAIGLNAVDPNAYEGWNGELKACENDANDMAEIAGKAGCTGKTLLSAAATSSEVLSSLFAAAKALDPGDLFVLTYSGHGGQVGDVNGDEEEDGLDETWCLYDRMLIDDELYAMWSQFKPGVRIVVFSDSCHSGTSIKAKYYEAFIEANKGDKGLLGTDALQLDAPELGGIKAIPSAKGWQVYLKDRPLYDALQYVAGPSEKSAIGASVVLISGCQDNQLSMDGDGNSLFTWALKKVWHGGNFTKNYAEFRAEIVKLMPPSQTPNYFVVGSPNLAFEAQKPFSV